MNYFFEPRMTSDDLSLRIDGLLSLRVVNDQQAGGEIVPQSSQAAFCRGIVILKSSQEGSMGRFGMGVSVRVHRPWDDLWDDL